MPQHTKKEWENALRNNNIFLFPDSGDKSGKEFLAGYTQAEIGDITGRKESRLLRNKIIKELRGDGWQTFTEPESHMGGSPYMEYPFSAARVI